MQDILNSLGWNQTDVGAVAALSRLLAALLCGGLIGFDRELNQRSAGLRTHMLVALASALFTLLTFEIVASVDSTNASLGIDPVRVVEALTSGVAFLAAGTIIVNQGNVRGLTTGASLWLAGAAGLATGMGLYWLAFVVTGMALLVLVVMEGLKIALASLGKHLKRKRED